MTRTKKMSVVDEIELFRDHRCPKCGHYDVEFYYPMLKNGILEQDIECQDCGFYIVASVNITEVKYDS